MTVAVADDSSTTFYATATDAAGNVSPCSTSNVTYVEISTAPAAPTALTTSPASPANNNAPRVLGTADAGSTVKIYTNATCTSAVAVTGTAANFASPGLAVTVADDSSTTFYATATNGVGNVSTCSTDNVTYVEDSTAPAAPTGLTTSPASPANNNNPSVLGTAQTGSTVKIFTNAACTSALAATGTAANFASPGLTVTVADNSSTTFHATATDAAGNESACSTSSATYVEDSIAPVVALTQVNGSDATPFPFTSSSPVTSLGGDCGTEADDAATVNIAITGPSAESGSATCDTGEWNYTLTTALTLEGAYSVTITQADAAGNIGTDTQTVSVDSLPSAAVSLTATPNAVPESGGTVAFSVTVTNTSPVDAVTITSLTDDVFGDLLDNANPLVSNNTCLTAGLTLGIGAEVSCSFEGVVSGNAGDSPTNQVDVSVQDDEGTIGTGFDFVSIDITDVAPTITIAVDSAPTTVPYPGGNSTFTATVTNTSAFFDTITLDTLTDTVHGNLDGVGTCTTGVSIAPSESYTCTFTVAASGSVGTVVTNAVTASVSDDDGVGIDTSATDDATVTITARAITVTADAGQSKVYGSADPTLTYSVTSGSLQSGDSFTGALARTAGENIGTFGITQGTLTAGPNYTLTFVPADFSITARPITVTADSGESKVYGTPDPALTYSVTSGALQGADTLTGAVARVAGENVGTYAISQGTLAASSNYVLTFVGADFTITPRLITVTATTDTKTYDATTASAAVPTITTGTLAGTDTATFTQTFGNKNVGTGKTLTPAGTVSDGNGGANYTITFVTDTSGVITARAITVTASSDTKVVRLRRPLRRPCLRSRRARWPARTRVRSRRPSTPPAPGRARS